MTKKRQSLLGNLALSACVVIGFFVVVEVILRVTGIDKGRPHTPPIYQKSDDPALSYELKPDLEEKAFRSVIKTDRRGFRSEEIHPGKPTIAVLGDSVAFGYGLENEETLPARLHALFDGKFNVVNAAVPGYTLGQEAALYENKVSLLHPSTVVLVFYWNDLTESKPAVLDDDGNLQAPGWTPSKPKCHPMEEGLMGWLPGRCWLDLHSAFYRTLKKLIVARTEKENLAAQHVTYRENAFGDSVTEEQVRRYVQELAAFSRALPRTTQKLFVIWPEKQLHLEITPKLVQAAERAGFRALNLYEVFGNRPESLEWDTVHPNAKTVDEAAAVIKAALEQWELLPQ